MRSDRLLAPWTPEQVERLNWYQSRLPPNAAMSRMVFTCRRRNEAPHRLGLVDRGVLRATPAGWVCDDCDYTQDWAYEAMLDVPDGSLN